MNNYLLINEINDGSWFEMANSILGSSMLVAGRTDIKITWASIPGESHTEWGSDT
jgi:hypothetical protein